MTRPPQIRLRPMLNPLCSYVNNTANIAPLNTRHYVITFPYRHNHYPVRGIAPTPGQNPYGAFRCHTMRHTSSIAFYVIAIALLSIAIALWPPGAPAGPPAQTPPDPLPATAPKVQSMTFSGTPRSGYHKAEDSIRITVKFDRAVTVSGRP